MNFSLCSILTLLSIIQTTTASNNLDPQDMDIITHISGIYKAHDKLVALHHPDLQLANKDDKTNTGQVTFIIEIDHVNKELDEACILAADEAFISAFNGVYSSDDLPTFTSAVAESTFYQPINNNDDDDDDDNNSALTVNMSNQNNIEQRRRYGSRMNAWVVGFSHWHCSMCSYDDDDADFMLLNNAQGGLRKSSDVRGGLSDKKSHKLMEDVLFSGLKTSGCDAFSDITVVSITLGKSHTDAVAAAASAAAGVVRWE